MKKSARFKQIAGVADHREKEAGRLLAQQRQAFNNQQQQLQQLEQFRSEYLDRYKQLGVTGSSVQQLRDFQLFLGKLEGAVNQQKSSVERSRQQFDKAHQHWLHARQRLQALEKAVDQQRALEQFLLDKKQQAETDELAGRGRPSVY